MDDSNSVAWVGVELFNKLKMNIVRNIENNAEDVCVAMKSDGNWNIFHDCYSVTNSIPACNVCQFDRVPSFLVKGICTGGPNWIYYLVQDNTGHFFEGYKRDKIINKLGLSCAKLMLSLTSCHLVGLFSMCLTLKLSNFLIG